MLVVADDDNLDLAAEFGFDTLEVSNDLLGRKWNDGIGHALRELDADYVTVVGSDDWVHPDVFDVLPADVAPHPMPTAEVPVVMWSDNQPEATTGREIALVDLASGRLRRCRSQGRYGVIPWVFPRVALERCGGRPVAETAQRGLDGSLVAGLGIQPQWVFHDPHDLCRLDFKSDVNLNSYETITAAIGYGPEETDPWALLATRYPADLVEMARETALERV